MNLFEYEGKKLFKAYDIPVPKGVLIVDSSASEPMKFPFVLKAQVLTGGRGKAGGVKICTNNAEYIENIKNIMGMTIKGHPVHAVLAEEAIKYEAELYLSITLQSGRPAPLLIASRQGGVNIEEAANNSPDEIFKIEIDPFIGIKSYQIDQLSEKLELERNELAQIIQKLYKLFKEQDALLVEINPLGVVNGKLVAMDSKVILDDEAEKRHACLFNELKGERKKLREYIEPCSDGTTITFVPLCGEVGLISDGAGTGMLALDLVIDEGGTVASFCELGGTTNAEVMYRAMELTLQPGNTVKSILIVLIGGFNKMDDMANGITKYMREHNINLPIFCRMCGTMEEEGIRIMEEAGLKTYRDLTEAVELSVQVIRGE